MIAVEDVFEGDVRSDAEGNVCINVLVAERSAREGVERDGGYVLCFGVPELHAPLTTGYEDLVQIGRRVMDHNGRKARFELDGRLKL